jgi:1,4-alpha-glucan branching enzyme
VRDLNTLYRAHPSLHVKDCEPEGFQWIEANAADESVFAWVRYGGPADAPVAVLANFTPVERHWRCGLPRPGRWREALNTDAGLYGGGDRGNMGGVDASGPGWHGQPHSAEITIPPLSAVFLIHESGQ